MQRTTCFIFQCAYFITIWDDLFFLLQELSTKFQQMEITESEKKQELQQKCMQLKETVEF